MRNRKTNMKMNESNKAPQVGLSLLELKKQRNDKTKVGKLEYCDILFISVVP